MPFPFTQARWLWTPERGDSHFAVRRFRTTLDIGDAQKAVCHVSADSRYLLYWDGDLVGRGPGRSDLRHYVYETYPLALTPGRHVLAATVVHSDRDTGPLAEMHDRGGFLLEMRDPRGGVLSATGETHWRVQTDTAYQPRPLGVSDGYYAIGMTECVDGAALPRGWERPGFDDASWQTPHAFSETYPFQHSPDLGGGGPWRLIPRAIPMAREEIKRFKSAPFPLTVPPHSRHETILSADVYTDAYPILHTEGGRGAGVTITYAEAMGKNGVKGVRDDRDGTDVVGFSDLYRPGGGTETYSPLHWRAFRFLKVTVETADAPLTITDMAYLETGYPWERQAAFAVDDDGPAELQAVQDIDFRTLERCTGETFMDCPYYEQLQYVGDTRLQALLSYVTTGDTRLGEWAVKQFDWSRLPEGLTQSRYPSATTQIIPPFSLIWVLMVEDLWRYAPEAGTTVARCLPGCRGVLEWFGQHTNAEGLLDRRLPWWNFVDWAEGFPEGVPAPAAAGRACATLNLQYLAALQAYVRLHEGLGDTRESEYWQAEADMLADAILLAFWDPDSRLLREGLTDDWGCTQHAQAWGILTGVIPTDALDDVVDSLHTDETLTKTSDYHTFYVVEALAKVGRLERLWTHWLAPWRDALSLHLTTWPEKSEPTRSDCHAWSAWPTYAFLTHVLGVKPVDSGFPGYAIDPRRVDGWDVLAGRVPTPAGLLSVSIAWLPDGNPRVAHGITKITLSP